MNAQEITVATLYEDCNCGSHIRHNNGGNYHEIERIVFLPETSEFWHLRTTTFEFDDWEELGRLTEDSLNELLCEWQKTKHNKGYTLEVFNFKPSEYDYEKLRRKCRDALNKTSDTATIVRVALSLNIKL